MNITFSPTRRSTGVGPSDPQMFEDVWIQDPMIVPFFWRPTVRYIVKFQRYYFIPICMFAGPYAIKVASLVKEKRPMEFLGIALHWVWVSALISCFPTWQEGLLFYGIAMLCLGILTIQLAGVALQQAVGRKGDGQDARLVGATSSGERGGHFLSTLSRLVPRWSALALARTTCFLACRGATTERRKWM